MTMLLYAAPPDIYARNKAKYPHSSHKQDYIQSQTSFSERLILMNLQIKPMKARQIEEIKL